MTLQQGSQHAYQLTWCQILLIHCTVDWSSVGPLLTFDRSPYMTLYNLEGVWWMTVGQCSHF